MEHRCSDGECWRQIPRAPLYSVSCLGRVRRDDTGRMMRGGLNGAKGYRIVNLIVDIGRARSFLVHRLMYEAFVGPIPAGMHVRHYNDTRGDNRLSNLDIGTPKENQQDRVRLGTYGHKLTEDNARQIQVLRAQGLTFAAIGARFGVAGSTAQRIYKGRSWAHLQPVASPRRPE